MGVTRVGVAIVIEGDRVLIGIRPPGVPLAGLAEFPGGKCELEETAVDCAVRECAEETGAVVVPVARVACEEHTYPHATVAIEFWECRLAEHQPLNATEFPSPPHRWIPLAELGTLEFPAANAAVIARLGQRNAKS